MATLNYNWQELGSKNLYNVGSSTIVIHIDGRLISQSTENNTSSIELRFRSTGYAWRTTNGTVAFTGEYTDSASCATYPEYITDGATVFTISKTITHNADGTKTFNIGGTISAYLNGASRSATISNVGVTLPTIPRASSFSGGSGNIGQATNIYITRASNSFTHNLYYTFGNIGITLIASNVATSYVWTIPTSFYAQIPNASSGTGTLYCETISNGVVIGTKTILFTATVTNSNPTFNVAYQDTNATTIAITNNNQQIIQNNSTLQFNITNASAKNSASLVNVKVTINGVTQTKSNTSATYNFNYGTVNVANNTNATVVVTDSRGFTTTKTVALTILGWQQPSAIISLGRDSNYYSSSYINVDANYSSLDSKNTISIKYRKKKTTASSWGSYTTLSDNVQATFTADNLYEWNVQVVVQDILATTTYNLTLPIGQPILFVDRNKRAVGVDCFPSGTNAFEVTGDSAINGTLKVNGEKWNQRNIIYAYADGSSAITYNIPSAWAWNKVPLNTCIKGGNFAHWDSTNKRIVLDKAATMLRLSTGYNWYNYLLTGDRSVGVFRNGLGLKSMGYANYGTGTSYGIVTSEAIVTGTFNIGDYFELWVSAGNSGTETLFANNSNYLIVELIE